MNWSVWCLFVILVNPGSSYVNDVNDTTVLENRFARWTERIVNGKKARKGQFPFMVSLQKRWSPLLHFCGASIISDRWIVTAAHCIIRGSSLTPKWAVIAVAGDNNLDSYYSPYRQIRNVEQFVVNPRFDTLNLANDIALISLQAPFLISLYVSPIPLAKRVPPAGTNCSVSGWGFPGESNRTIVKELMFVHLPLISYNYCGKLLWGIITMHPSMICAGYLGGGKDACQGDSGGPFVCENSLTGIVSGGRGCARPKIPGFYVNVAYYVKWIEQVLKTNGKNHSYDGSTRHPASNLTVVISSSIFYVTSCLLITVYLYDIVKI
ncbi:trypsin-2-like [Microplitis mediator]|uniref:trypsin-2-like n=1 Tax=Microplitis mediator TaxID=375433 RepID=UPI0025526637|nr:trypsin-2-like [Microplitis mediator]